LTAKPHKSRRFVAPTSAVLRRGLLALVGFLPFSAPVVTIPSTNALAQSSGEFENYEIRVIRPRYFTKTGRMELGGQMSIVMNQTFIYTYLATGILNYHFSEMWSLELGGAFGFSVPKEDMRLLDSEFDIQTQILRTQYIFSGGVLWTPIYGKYQLSTGRVLYFDTFLSAGAGMTGVEYIYDHCPDRERLSDGSFTAERPAAQTKGYPTFAIGIGQRFFLSRSLALRWDVRDHFFSYNEADGACDPANAEGASNLHQNVTMQLGASHFF
jgi:outer membrane beta-barrel protein